MTDSSPSSSSPSSSSLSPLPPSDLESHLSSSFLQKRRGSGLPSSLTVLKLLGKGSNNRVFLAEWKGTKVIVRQPRRGSDTQLSDNARSEFTCALLASGKGVAPLIYDSWYTRHATSKQKSGLHMVTERFDDDVHTLLTKEPEVASLLAPDMGRLVCEKLLSLAELHIFSFDLKPSNIVYRRVEGKESKIDIRFIDFGKDFCEWRPYSPSSPYENVQKAPILSFIQTLADSNTDSRLSAERLYVRLIYTTMLIILSANLSFMVDQSRSLERIGTKRKAKLCFLTRSSEEMRREVRGSHINLVRQILRHNEVRSTMRHYMGRRNAGTRRCFRFAGFLPKDGKMSGISL